MKPKVFLLVALMAVLSISTPAFAQQEEITLSTYYPAPYGEYEEMAAEKLFADKQIIGNMDVNGDGIFSDTADINAMGVGSLLVENNVGIGTTSPGSKLHVNRDVRISPFTSGTAGGYLNEPATLRLINGDIYNSGGGAISRIIFGGMYNPAGTQWDATYNYIEWKQGELKIRNNQQDKLIIGGGNEWGRQNVVINPTGGNVGIGTTSPNYKLEISGGHMLLGTGAYPHLLLRDSSFWLGVKTGSPFGLTDPFIINSNAARDIVFSDGATPTDTGTTGGAANVVIKSNGNVGIGTTNPQAKLHIGGTAGTDGVMFPDGSLQTVAATSRIAQAIGTTDISAPATETDMPNMSVTLNTGTKVLVMFSAPFWAASLNSGALLKLYLDGTEIRRIRTGLYAWFDVAGFQHLVVGLTPGSHTIKIRWDEYTGDLRQRGSTDGQRVLTVVGLD